MDMLENPFIRLRYFYDPRALCQRMDEAGFSLYSSWPPYKDGLRVQWFKTRMSAEEQLRSQDEFIARSLLSHLFGRAHYLVRRDPSLEERVSNLLALTDSLIDTCEPDQVRQCVESLSVLATVLQTDAVVAQPQEITETLHTIHSLQSLLDLLMQGKVEELIAFCNRDHGFIQGWGMTQHFAVFQKRS